MRLLQYVDNQQTRVARVDSDLVTPLVGVESVYALARKEIGRASCRERV